MAASCRARLIEICDSGLVAEHVHDDLWSFSIQCHSGVIQGTCLKMALYSKTPGRWVKHWNLVFRGINRKHMGYLWTHSDHVWSYGVFVSKWPVNQKLSAMEKHQLIEIWGPGRYSYYVYGVPMTSVCPRSLMAPFSALVIHNNVPTAVVKQAIDFS